MKQLVSELAAFSNRGRNSNCMHIERVNIFRPSTLKKYKWVYNVCAKKNVRNRQKEAWQTT